MQESTPVDALRRHADPIATTTPGDGTDGAPDLAPIADAIGDAVIVGLGEATHGSREFFQLKDRLIRHLVQAEGVRLVGMESNFAETMALDRYVTRGEGDVLDALEDIYFWTWDTTEVVALVEWLREFNEGRPRDDRVRFWGYDMQYTSGSAAALQDYLADAAPALRDEWHDTLELLQERDIRTDTDGDYDARLDETRALVNALGGFFEEREPDLVAATDRTATERARQHVRVIEQSLDSNRATHEDDLTTSVAVRDRSMAENVSWLLDHSRHDRIALWAHNEHVRRGHTDGEDWGPARTMGDHLADRHGDDYHPIGFDFGRGGLQAMVETNDGYDLQACTIDHTPADSLTETLAHLDHDQYHLDLQACQNEPATQPLVTQEQAIHSIGAMFYGDGSPRHQDHITPADAYDGLIFVQETTRAVPTDRDN